MGHPLPKFNGTDRHTLPIPATFVLDGGGVVRFRFVDPDYMYRADPADIVATLRSISWLLCTSVPGCRRARRAW